ncbi:MAG: RhuM [Candidatus Moranbacteria bacterium GW2011_GWE1_49_15]|nr:MAG: RhuM [Candidatus Moranbacteria bacterium GW2011_GWE2_47_10]KKW06531.1 MAG: RhuM [Candidatus Moranbacteria bacterium GW2011_GWE1_49_15]HBP01023.1 death-on-curing protein [Candidatus Moranbacteria bacterium]
MKKKKREKIENGGEILIYRTDKGPELEVHLKKETVWLTQEQISILFGTKRPAITKHLQNIFKSGELDKNSVSSILEHTANDGKVYKTQFYDLDAIISIGYRVNSKQATQFRIWATKTLREHITKGYTINRKQIAQNYDEFMRAVASIQNLLPEHVTLDPKLILELIKEFSSTWMTLDAYDKEELKPMGKTGKAVKLTGEELKAAIADLRSELIEKGEASELFAQEKREGSVEGIVGNVMQSFGGKGVYPTSEEKAAHLLYFMVKNHPFNDGNKRSGAFAFVWFLRKAKIKGAVNINPSALTALTLLIAESQPAKKGQMTALVTTLLSAKK